MDFLTSACCNTAPVQAEYTPIGQTCTDDTSGMTYYIVGDKESRRGIVFCYDIFGFHPNAYQVADILGLEGLRVIVPDYLEGKPLTLAELKQPEVFHDFKTRRGTYAYCRPMTLAAVNILRTEGCEQIGGVGFCWGAKLVMGALAEKGKSGVASGALLHPSFLEMADFEQAQGPILLLLSKDEPDFQNEFAVAKAQPFSGDSRMERFSKQVHGFCGARGDFGNDDVTGDVDKALAMTATFFKRTLAA
ncbi:hypothetical protein GGI19_003170 [Coemansia pectinata]|uniref:Dienelactone hydrolase domain-containing protein n=1 Tax=Coemansia pectinata TaxID=1052879 RepID=A0A9W8GUB2_9FUNG|nr:hypothetical protein GGI19_003170 [Coemansia pectinata]